MSSGFFDNFRNLGLLVMIMGALDIIAALIGIVAVITNNNFTAVPIATVLASFIVGAIFFMFGNSLRTGKISRKIDFIANFVIIFGVAFIVTAVIIGIAMMPENFGSGLVYVIIGVIIGAVLVLIGKQVNDGKVTMGDRLIYFILLIATILIVLFAILGLIGFFTAISLDAVVSLINDICNIILGIFIVKFLFDPEVKKDMGMN